MNSPTVPARPRTRARSLLRRTIWLIRSAVLIFIIGATIALTLIFAAAFRARSLPPLESWHRASPASDFRARDAKTITTLAQYLALEDRVFAELKAFDLTPQQAAEMPWAARYIPGNPLHPESFDHNWNRTTILEPDGTPRGTALLLHGATDSPFSFRAIGKIMQSEGWRVICLRLPGHGTTPAGIMEIDWRDWQAAINIVARDIKATTPDDHPVIVGGFSLGGALALRFALDATEDATLPMPERVFLFSPAVGVSSMARFAEAAMIPTVLPYFEKARWLGIAPEFDPFKYNSFPKRAGFEVWAVTDRNLRDMEALAAKNRLGELPAITAFASVVDTTVDNNRLLRLLKVVPAKGSDITLFDINRRPRFERFFRMDVDVGRNLLNQADPLGFDLTLITNADANTLDLIARTRLSGQSAITDRPTDLAWSHGVLSLSHSAIPFAPDDPVYGPNVEQDAQHPIAIGAMVIRSERGALTLGAETLMRMRFNPFFDIVEKGVRARLPRREP